MSDNVISLFGENTLSPELGAKVLSEVMRIVITANAPMFASAVFDDVVKATDLEETELAGEVDRAIFILVKTGVLESDDFKGDEMLFYPDTVVKSSSNYAQFIWGDVESVTPVIAEDPDVVESLCATDAEETTDEVMLDLDNSLLESELDIVAALFGGNLPETTGVVDDPAKETAKIIEFDKPDI